MDDDFGVNGELRYTFDEGIDATILTMFNLDEYNGVLSLISPVDREKHENFSFLVKATDSGGKWSTGNNILLDIPVFSLLLTTDFAYGISNNMEEIYYWGRKNVEYQSLQCILWFTDGFYCFLARVMINVIDVNDNEPVFVSTHYNFEVSESAKSGDKIGYVRAFDEDKSDNIIYTIEDSPENEYIHLDKSSGFALYYP